MKVKCIAEHTWMWNKPTIKKILWFTISKKFDSTTGPKNGDIVTVIDERWSEGILYYVLLEWPKGGAGYDSKWFKPIEEKFEEVSFEQLKKEKPVSVN